jgi:hypothetical protein
VQRLDAQHLRFAIQHAARCHALERVELLERKPDLAGSQCLTSSIDRLHLPT